jgi:ABC-2 type transport system ATP-binding protein
MIQTEGLTRRYGALLAVDNLSFAVEPGEVLGFLGPNGAGKSTTMRMLAGFVTPSAGRASICGHDVVTDAVAAKRALGYLPEGAPLYGEMSVRGFLEFIADLRGLAPAARRARLDHVIERLQLAAVLSQSIETLSKGFRRRVGLAQAIIADPPVLILDEPTDGLDPNQKHEVRGLISEMARDKLIVISTHILEEVDAVCTRAMIIARGKCVADDTPGNLAARSKYFRAATFQVAEPAEMARACAVAQSVSGAAGVETDARSLRVTILPLPGADLLPALDQLRGRSDFAVKGLALEAGRLDDVFRTLTA